ncbi:MAG: thymidylate synthase [Egibacteraceae bacterium]
MPCTLGYRFFLRAGRLHMHTTMRSQDLWLGFCYDLFTATVLQELLAGWLGAELGEYRHHIDSLHLYQNDLAVASRLPDPAGPSPAMPPLGVDWDSFDALLQQVIAGLPVANEGWAELSGVLASYRVWKVGDRVRARVLAAQTAGLLAHALGRWYDHLERHATPQAAKVARR